MQNVEVHLLLMLLALSGQAISGDIYVQAPPGYSVNLDGRPQGVVRVGASGLVIREVEPGMHRVDVLKPGGAGATQHQVEVKPGQTTNVLAATLATIARPRAAAKTGDVQVKTPQSPCSATIAGTRHDLPTRDTTLRNLPLGKHHLRVECGVLRAEGEIEVRDGLVVTVDADLAKRRLAVAGERPRSVKVIVASSDENEIPATLPGDWRRALSAVIDSTIHELQITRTGYSSVKMTFRYTNYDDAWRLASRLDARAEVHKVTVVGFDRSGQGGRCEIAVEFVSGD